MNEHSTPETLEHQTPRYDIRAIAPEALRRLRIMDDADRPPRIVVEDENGGSPLRCCLGRSGPHETIALVAYSPLLRWALDTGADPGPYNETGPVFVHREPCGGWTGTGVPDGLRGDRRVLRAYSADGSILGGLLLDGGTPTIEEGLDQLYRDPRVAAVHVRAVEFGCFLAETRRR
ncbi:DUF1203 domain-containing protein [Streptomyces coffeae]|uniref:DUF1203 domain-containing protein n=1 Tax=Streptomyces coffeae TaxID=621382 RepID=A0ABS1NLI5_9ACTN|nr:DUF1203 domain-containing protein [Streptomyces coffeae]MBL1100938.1 DUF1203 domain-containing protein [Streptomyces coffeae]